MNLHGERRRTPVAGNGHFPHAGNSGIRIVITGKGGVGKTTITALLAHLFAQQGFRVLAIDGDPQQNLAVTLGIPRPEVERIIPVCQCVEYLREKTGTGPGLSLGGLLTLNPDVSDVVNRFSVNVTGNLRLLVMGGSSRPAPAVSAPSIPFLPRSSGTCGSSKTK